MGEIIPRPLPPTPLRFTGERLTSEYGGQTQIEHIHRYLFAREWCRGKDVLDVASGEGYGTALLAQVARSAVGVEIAPEAVAHAQAAYAREGLRFIHGDARALPVGDAEFDIVVSFETIEHFSEHKQFLDEIRRVLRPNGLLIVSTPDRDNYSIAETPANPYHVRELTGPEFSELLRSCFEEVSLLQQRPVFGSVLLPIDAVGAPPLCFERRGAEHFEASIGVARPQYFVAFASKEPVAALPPSVYIETGRLGMLNPSEAEAQLRAAQAASEADRTALEAERAGTAAEMAALIQRLGEVERGSENEREALLASGREHEARTAALNEELVAHRAELAAARAALEAERARAGAEIAALTNRVAEVERGSETERAASLARDREQEARIATLNADLVAHRAELTDAQGEARGLLAANEMAERACRSLRAELVSGMASRREIEAQAQRFESELVCVREKLKLSEARLANTEDHLLSTKYRLASTYVSHSWRLTAPLRRISRLVYRRP